MNIKDVMVEFPELNRRKKIGPRRMLDILSPLQRSWRPIGRKLGDVMWVGTETLYPTMDHSPEHPTYGSDRRVATDTRRSE